MKYTAIMILTFIVGIPVAFAERDSRWHHHEKRLEKLMDELELSAEQEPRVRQILEEQHGKMRNEMQRMHEDLKPKLEAIGSETSERLSSVLDEEQLQTFNEIVEKKREHMRKRFGTRHSHGAEE